MTGSEICSGIYCRSESVSYRKTPLSNKIRVPIPIATCLQLLVSTNLISCFVTGDKGAWYRNRNQLERGCQIGDHCPEKNHPRTPASLVDWQGQKPRLRLARAGQISVISSINSTIRPVIRRTTLLMCSLLRYGVSCFPVSVLPCFFRNVSDCFLIRQQPRSQKRTSAWVETTSS